MTRRQRISWMLASFVAGGATVVAVIVVFMHLFIKQFTTS